MVNTLPVAGVSSATVFVSATATGAVFGETTVITKVSVGQFVVWPGAHTGMVYVYVPAAVAVNV